jgi:hypothetical protein
VRRTAPVSAAAAPSRARHAHLLGLGIEAGRAIGEVLAEHGQRQPAQERLNKRPPSLSSSLDTARYGGDGHAHAAGSLGIGSLLGDHRSLPLPFRPPGAPCAVRSTIASACRWRR